MSGVSIATGVIATDALGGGTGRGLQSPGVLKQTAVAVPVTGTLSETVLGTVVIPGGILGINGSIRIISRWSYTNSANNKVIRVRFAGTDFLGFTATTTVSCEILTIIQNRGVANSQIGDRLAVSAGTGSSVAPFTTSAVNTLVDQNITFTGTLANTGETITLESYIVEIINP